VLNKYFVAWPLGLKNYANVLAFSSQLDVQNILLGARKLISRVPCPENMSNTDITGIGVSFS